MDPSDSGNCHCQIHLVLNAVVVSCTGGWRLTCTERVRVCVCRCVSVQIGTVYMCVLSMSAHEHV